ncbi:thiosulfate reductase PhsA [Desulfosediminicola sp.]|uniref:thiosulfate reductase PhsA n=1 Tax=Desulfosediminicola sp. TaxID=2886825 RepID=UPI003AF255D0
MEITRRTFLKSATICGAYCALSGAVPGTLASLYAETPELVAQHINSMCEMCSTRCPITAEIINGKNVYLGGNPLAKSFGGSVCARGGAGHSLLYDPDRLVKPIRRVGERGEGKWEEISWEEAYSYIAEKLLAIKLQHGPESVAFSTKSGSGQSHLFHLAQAYGSPNTFTHATTCPGAYQVAGRAMFAGSLSRDIGNSRYIINFGHNVYEGINMPETIGMMENQRAKGAKLVVFEPRFSILADKADEWHPIRPGSDICVALAMCQVLIEEDLYDKEFVDRYVHGFEEFSEAVANYTPEWAEELSDVKAADIVRIAREIASHAPHALIDYGHRTTFTTEEFDLRRTLYALNVLLGNIERKGGLYFSSNPAKYNTFAGEEVAPVPAGPFDKVPKVEAQRIDQADTQYYLLWSSGGVYQSILDAALSADPYQLKAWVITRSNPMQTMTDRARVEEALKALDLVVACDVYISETAAFADIILPESTYLERAEDIFDRSGKFPRFSIRQPVVKTIGDTKPGWQIWRELGLAMGLGEYYKSWNDIDDFQLAQFKGDAATLNKLKQDGWIEFGKAPLITREKSEVSNFVKAFPNARTPDYDGTYSSSLKFNTPTGKIELSSPKVEEMAPGRGIIRYRPVTLKKDDELYFIQGKTAIHTNGATHNVPMLSNMMSDNGLWIHPVVAKKMGIVTGDKIRIYNDLGSEEGSALVTPGIRPDTVFAYMGFGSKNKELKRAYDRGIHCGNLLPHITAPVCGMNLHTSGVKIEKI